MIGLWIYVDYEEFNPSTYKAVEVSGDGPIEYFNSGDYDTDIEQARKFCEDKLGYRKDGVPCWGESSDVGHYEMDRVAEEEGRTYKGIYLDGDEETRKAKIKEIVRIESQYCSNEVLNLFKANK